MFSVAALVSLFFARFDVNLFYRYWFSFIISVLFTFSYS